MAVGMFDDYIVNISGRLDADSDDALARRHAAQVEKLQKLHRCDAVLIVNPRLIRCAADFAHPSYVTRVTKIGSVIIYRS